MSMDTETEIPPRVSKIWGWYQEAMYRYANRRVNFPQSTDPKKTYQYRYIQAFIKKIDEWEFDDGLAQQMVLASEHVMMIIHPT